VGALASDIHLMRGSQWGETKTSGDLLPEPGPIPADSTWGRLVDLPTLDRVFEIANPSSMQQGELGPSWMSDFLGALRPHEALPVGKRLILFAEIDPASTNSKEWVQAINTILPLLPKRFGVVVSGAPPELRRPRDIRSDDPHFAIVSASDVPQAVDEGDPTYLYADSPLSGDQPADHDLLGVGRYADALARLVLHKDTKPLTIGIHGPWGSGKSSFMQLIKQGLHRHAPRNERNGLSFDLAAVEEQVEEYQPEQWERNANEVPITDLLADADERRRKLLSRLERKARRDVVAVEFNAWQYDSETQIWAGLASEISRALEHAMPWYRRLILPVRYAVGRRTSEVLLGVLVPVTAVAVALAILSRIAISDAAGTKILGDLAVFASALPAGALVIGVLLWRTAVVAIPVSKRILKDARGPDYTDQMGFQSQVLSDLTFVTQQLRPLHFSPRRPRILNRNDLVRSVWPVPKSRPMPPRIVVFIDDLDRCSDEKVVDILQAINLILGKSSFFVFLGMDTDMIYRAIDARYKVEKGTGQPTFAESYLRKIVQLSFHLPTTEPGYRFTLVKRMFSPAARQAFGPGDAEDGASLPNGPRDATGSSIIKSAFEIAAAINADDGADTAASRSSANQPTDGINEGIADVFRFDRSILLSPRVAVLKEVEDTPEELKAFEEFTPFMSPNPREIKRLVNVHRLVRILLVRQESPLTKEAQRKLVAWLIFSSRWPDLVDDILRIAKNAQSRNCLTALADRQTDPGVGEELIRLSEQLGDSGKIAPEDLRAQALLPEAALVSQMVRDIPAESPAVTPPVAPATSAVPAPVDSQPLDTAKASMPS
jgi:hypothetical protein